MKSPSPQMQLSSPKDCRMRVLAYHEFTLTSSKDIYHLHPKVFELHVRAAISAANKSATSLLFTFDDAHISQIELAAPLLESYGMHGMFFVPASWVDTQYKIASWSMLRNLLSKGHIVGSHGLSHKYLPSCSTQKLKHELGYSRTMLEDHLGQPVRTISMPGGRWNLNVMQACLEAGYRDAFTSKPDSRDISLQNINGEYLTVHGRLVVRRTMSAQLLAGYISDKNFSTAFLKCEYTLKQLLHDMLGDSIYRSLWRGLLRQHE